MLDCQIATLRDCDTAKFRDCAVATVRDCEMARLQTAKLRDFKTAICGNATLPDCEITNMRGCEDAVPRDSKIATLRHSEIARFFDTAKLREWQTARLRDNLRDGEAARSRDCKLARRRSELAAPSGLILNSVCHELISMDTLPTIMEDLPCR